MEEENKDAVTKMDITLHEKSQDLTDARINLDKNIYQNDDVSQTDVHGDFMKSQTDNKHHGKSNENIAESTFSF